MAAAGEAKPVQELIENVSNKEDEDVLHKYIYKETIDQSLPLAQIPLIDISNLSQPDEIEKLRSSLASWGCFQAINHGMTSLFLDQVREITKQFFALAPEEKKRYSRRSDDIEGYGTDMVLYENQILDWTDRLYLAVHPQERKNLHYWPHKPANFRKVLDEFTAKCKDINEDFLKAMAKSLNLGEKCFLQQYVGGEGDGTMYARFNLYPECPRPEQILALKPHADGTAVTLLLQDKEVEGLQILQDKQWFRVESIPDALLINVGDQIEIMSNGKFKSPVHRVVTNLVKPRISLAIFCIPGSETEIEPAKGLVSEDEPRLYKTVKNYVDIYFQNYQQGKRPIDAVKI